MATTITSKAAPQTSAVQTPDTPQTIFAALAASPGAYAQAEDQKNRDAINDLRLVLINAGLVK